MGILLPTSAVCEYFAFGNWKKVFYSHLKMVNPDFHSSILESGKLWPSTGAIAGNDSFVAMYEGLGHKCIHLLQLISGRIIQQHYSETKDSK